MMRFLLAAFFLSVFFLATFFLEAFFLVTFFLLVFFFLVAGFFRDTFFLLAAFLAAGFFLAMTFFFDDFFADDFFLLTVRFLPAVFFRLTSLLDAAFFLVALTFFRFLLTVILAAILQFLPDRKARHYTPVISAWKGVYSGFLLLFGRFFRKLRGRASETQSGAAHRHHLLLGWQQDKTPKRSFPGPASVLEVAATAALSDGCLFPATIVLFAELLYTTPELTGYGHHTT